MKYSFAPHAEKELEDTENYYDNISEELGDRFRDEIKMTVSRILKFQRAGNNYRKLFDVVGLIIFVRSCLSCETRRDSNLGRDASPSRTEVWAGRT